MLLVCLLMHIYGRTSILMGCLDGWMQGANVRYQLNFCLFVSCQLNFGHFSVVS